MKIYTYICIALLSMAYTTTFAASSYDASNTTTKIQRVRIDVKTPLGYTKHLLLGFTPNNAASDGVDYGYDAKNNSNQSNDCSWIIEDGLYNIQGVGAFDNSKTYPLGLFLEDSGNVEFSLLGLENFDHDISVYIYDAYLETVTLISEESLVEYVVEGVHTNRFFITFTNHMSLMNFSNSTLSVNEVNQQSTSIQYISSTKELKIKTFNTLDINEISVYNILGKKVKYWQHLNSNSNGSLHLTLSHLSKGTYIVRVKTKHGLTVKRLIVS